MSSEWRVGLRPPEEGGGVVVTHRPSRWPGWQVRYWIAERGPGLEVERVTVEPRGEAQPGGVPARLIRQVQTTYAVTHAREHLRRVQASRPEWSRRALIEHGLIEVARQGASPAGGSRLSDEFLAEVAARYVSLVSSGIRHPIAPLIEQLESEAQVSRSRDAVEGWVRAARRRGLLTPPPPGRAGGELTERALQILTHSSEEMSEAATALEWVWMRHEALGRAPAPVTRRALEAVWSERGWVYDGEAEAPEVHP